MNSPSITSARCLLASMFRHFAGDCLRPRKRGSPGCVLGPDLSLVASGVIRHLALGYFRMMSLPGNGSTCTGAPDATIFFSRSVPTIWRT